MKGGLHGQRAALQAHLLFLHHLQQGRLGLGGGAVHLVGQEEVGEHGPLAEVELFALHVPHRMPHDIARHEIRGELDARESAPEGGGQGAHQESLAQTGDSFEQHVPAGQEGREHLADHSFLADQGTVDLRP